MSDLMEMAAIVRQQEAAERDLLRYDGWRNRQRLDAYRERLIPHVTDHHEYLHRQQAGAKARLRALLRPDLLAESEPSAAAAA